MYSLGVHGQVAAPSVASAASSRPAVVPRNVQSRPAAAPTRPATHSTLPVSPIKYQQQRTSSVVAMASAGAKQSAEVPIAELRTLCTKALKTLSYTADEIEILNDVS